MRDCQLQMLCKFVFDVRLLHVYTVFPVLLIKPQQ